MNRLSNRMVRLSQTVVEGTATTADAAVLRRRPKDVSMGALRQG
jgi:hypothetical protein